MLLLRARRDSGVLCLEFRAQGLHAAWVSRRVPGHERQGGTAGARTSGIPIGYFVVPSCALYFGSNPKP